MNTIKHKQITQFPIANQKHHHHHAPLSNSLMSTVDVFDEPLLQILDPFVSLLDKDSAILQYTVQKRINSYKCH